ncbi:MAG: hypothetical protein GX216_09730 [Methanomicrobiales archaeon]|nr:hypothetical protein [Methanomicrobiales archaeon]
MVSLGVKRVLRLLDIIIGAACVVLALAAKREFFVSSGYDLTDQEGR